MLTAPQAKIQAMRFMGFQVFFFVGGYVTCMHLCMGCAHMCRAGGQPWVLLLSCFVLRQNPSLTWDSGIRLPSTGFTSKHHHTWVLGIALGSSIAWKALD